MTRLTTAAFAISALLLVPASSHAGGWATVGLSSMPDDARPGEEWVVDLTVLQHGKTPLEDVTPIVAISPEAAAGAKRRTFEAKPTKEAGVYRVRVDFPSNGAWDVSVHDGFSGVHDFGVVSIGDDVASARAASCSGRAGGIQVGIRNRTRHRAPPRRARGTARDRGHGAATEPARGAVPGVIR